MVLTASRQAATAPRPRRRLVAGSLLAAVVLAAGLALLAGGGDDTGDEPAADVLPVPPRGEASAEVLADGTAVFVVHARAGDVYVVRAALEHGATVEPVGVGWCARARTFEAPERGYLFDARGRPLGGGPPGGLEVLPSEPGDGGRLVVIARRGEPLQDHRRTPPIGRPCLAEPHLLVVHDEVVVRTGD